MVKVLSTMIMEINNTKVNLKMAKRITKVLSTILMEIKNTKVNLKIA
jgi:hypothetical protein